MTTPAWLLQQPLHIQSSKEAFHYPGVSCICCSTSTVDLQLAEDSAVEEERQALQSRLQKLITAHQGLSDTAYAVKYRFGQRIRSVDPVNEVSSRQSSAQRSSPSQPAAAGEAAGNRASLLTNELPAAQKPVTGLDELHTAGVASNTASELTASTAAEMVADTAASNALSTAGVTMIADVAIDTLVEGEDRVAANNATTATGKNKAAACAAIKATSHAAALTALSIAPIEVSADGGAQSVSQHLMCRLKSQIASQPEQ